MIDAETAARLLAQPDQSSAALAQLLQTRLQPSHFTLVVLLLRHWHLVAATADNRMDCKAVATCGFGALFGACDVKLVPLLALLVADAHNLFGADGTFISSSIAAATAVPRAAAAEATTGAAETPKKQQGRLHKRKKSFDGGNTHRVSTAACFESICSQS